MGIEDLKVLSFRHVMDLTGLPKSTIRDMVVAGTFPDHAETAGVVVRCQVNLRTGQIGISR